VRKRLGRYWLLYSGGAWTGDMYAVSWASADHPLGPWTDAGATLPPLLRGTSELVGPGHCSVVAGPDGEDWLAYHAWDAALTARRMCLDRIEWTEDGPRTAGPTTTPQVIERR
jgi:beta-xylosidase